MIASACLCIIKRNCEKFFAFVSTFVSLILKASLKVILRSSKCCIRDDCTELLILQFLIYLWRSVSLQSSNSSDIVSTTTYIMTESQRTETNEKIRNQRAQSEERHRRSKSLQKTNETRNQQIQRQDRLQKTNDGRSPLSKDVPSVLRDGNKSERSRSKTSQPIVAEAELFEVEIQSKLREIDNKQFFLDRKNVHVAGTFSATESNLSAVSSSNGSINGIDNNGEQRKAVKNTKRCVPFGCCCRSKLIVVGLLLCFVVGAGFVSFKVCLILIPHLSGRVQPEVSTTATKPTSATSSVSQLYTTTPTFVLSNPPSSQPSLGPSATPISSSPTALEEYVTTFYAIGDVPYTKAQHRILDDMMPKIPSDAEFVIHVGDMRFSRRNVRCNHSDYASVAETLRASPAPVFIILGDNEWNDCPNPDEALSFWQSEFRHFSERYWPGLTQKFNISYQSNRPDNFAFVYKESLFVGINLVGGHIVNRTEWFERLEDQANWISELAMDLVERTHPRIPRIVIFGHADPIRIHSLFFEKLTNFISHQLQNRVPILYLCGDRHEWLYQPSFFNQSSFTRIILTGQTSDPPLKVMVHADGTNKNMTAAFLYDRMLAARDPSLNGTAINIDLLDETDDIVVI